MSRPETGHGLHEALYSSTHRPSAYNLAEKIIAENLAPHPEKSETPAEIAHRILRKLIEEAWSSRRQIDR
jgi:hypothetical protein